MKAMILAAGRGTRMGNITQSGPKALVNINGKSALHLAVEKCALSGFVDIIVNVHHFADLVEEEVVRLNKLGFRVSVSDEREQLMETGGGLFRAKSFFDNSPFLLYNTDIITDLHPGTLYNYHIKNKSLATLAVRNRPGNRFLLVNKEGILKGWCNNVTRERIILSEASEVLSEIAFSGIHIIDPEIFNYMTEGVYSMTSLYLKLAGTHTINTFRYDDGFWFDLGTPENLEMVRNFFDKRQVL